MDTISLLHSSGDSDVDRILRGLIGVFETAFPGRISAYYLVGSRADGSAVGASDIDFRPIFKGGFEAGEEERARQMRRYCGLICSMDLDMPMLSEELLTRPDVPERYGYALGEAPAIKTASRLLYGADIRDRIVLPPLDVYTREITHVHYLFAVRGLRQREWATFPLQYPDPEDVFYGYAPRGDTQALVLGAGWAGTAILALKAGQYVAKKSDWIDLYERYIGDEWTAFQAEIYRSCKQQWGYRIPEAPLERGRLKELCRQALAFENHYLAIYRDYLLAELHSDSDDHKLVAVRRLGQIVYPDEEVRDVLRTAAASPNEGLRHAAQATFERVQALFATAR